VISDSPKPLPTPWSKRGFPQPPQVDESNELQFCSRPTTPTRLSAFMLATVCLSLIQNLSAKK